MNTYLIDNREYTIAKDLISDLSKLEDNSIFDLSYIQAIKLQGPNVADFLQGQLTCDIKSISDSNIITGVLCNLQGRIVCKLSCILFKDEFYILCPKDLIKILLQNIKLSAQLSKIKISVEQNLNLYGIYKKDTSTLEYKTYPLNDNTYIFITYENLINNITHGSLAWHYYRLQENNFEIYPISQSTFLPHKLDLEKTNIISFNKGCYKGQEIIARMHYKAKKTHSLLQNIFISDYNLSIGDYVQNQEELGILVDYCPTTKPNQYLGLFCTNMQKL